MPGGRDPGPSIKKKATYEALKKKKGMSKTKAAKISNAQYDKEHGVKSSAKRKKK